MSRIFCGFNSVKKFLSCCGTGKDLKERVYLPTSTFFLTNVNILL